MTRVFAEERRARLLAELRRHGRVEVAALAGLLDVSEDTIRRDLRSLDAAGHLQKTHGGAVALDPARMSFAARADVAAAAKRAIAITAATLVQSNQTLMLDAGSTVLALAQTLRVRPLTVVTNSLDVGLLFDDDADVTVHLSGGQWHRHSRYFAGPAAVATIARYRADWAFLGACALHHKTGVTSVDALDAEVKAAMAAASLRVAILADSTKHATIAPHSVCSPEEMDVLITDARDAHKCWNEQTVDVYTVDPLDIP